MPDILDQLLEELDTPKTPLTAFLRAKQDANALFRQGTRVMQVFHMQGVTPSVQDDILRDELAAYFAIKEELVGVKKC